MNPITLPMAELRPALAGLSKIITRRPTLPVLGCIRIERTKTHRIELSATDLDTSAVVQFDTPAQGEPTTFLISYDDLNNIAKSCGKEDALVLTPVEENRLAIRFPVGGQMIEHRCDSIPVDEYPDIVEVRGEPIPLDVKLRNAIRDAMGCACVDQTRAILNGACLDVSQPQGHYVVATDGHHLFSSNSFKLPLKDSIIIPSHRFLNWKEFNQDGDWTLRASRPERKQPPRFEIGSRHWRFIAQSLEGHYPDWRAVVPDPGNVKTTVEIEFGAEEDGVIRTIARMPDHDAQHHAIGLEIAGNKLSLLSKSPGTDQSTRVELSAIKAVGPDVTIYLNRQFLTKALRLGLTRIEITDPLTPLRFGNGGRQMIVMPVRPAPASSTHTSRTQSAPVASTTIPPRHAEQPEKIPMSENSTITNGASRSTTTAAPMETAERPALETALAQIDVIRGEFRSAVAGLSKLGDLLKQASREQKVSEREVQGVRQTLRSLQSVRI